MECEGCYVECYYIVTSFRMTSTFILVSTISYGRMRYKFENVKRSIGIRIQFMD